MNYRQFFKWALLALMIGALAACGGIMGSPGKLGSLAIQVDNAVAKTLLPPVSMECASYDVTVTDAALNVIITENITADKTYSGILPGTYTVRLVGLNAATLPIGEGSNTVVVLGGDTAACPVIVAEFDGLGTLAVVADWTAYPGTVADPRIESELTYGGGAPADISTDWILGVDSANLSKSSLARGWYGLVMRLFDDGASEPSAGFATLARVVKDQTTSGEILLVPNALTGGFQILIDLDFYDPLTLTSNLPAGAVELYQGQAAQTITIAGADLYGWYVNGVAKGAGASFLLDETDYAVDGNYRIDALGWSADGKHAGQLTWNVSKADFNPLQVTVSWIGASTSYRVFVARGDGSGFSNLTEPGVVGANSRVITLEPGTFKICVYDETAMKYEYWESNGGSGGATILTAPFAEATVLNFGTLDFNL